MKIKLFLISLISFCISCSNESSGGPSSVETQNAMNGVVVDQYGSPVGKVDLYLYRAADQNPELIEQAKTDQNGAFEFLLSDSSLYNVIVKHDKNRSARILGGINQKTHPSIGVLQNAKSITLKFIQKDSIDFDSVKLFVLGVPGEISWKVNEPLKLSLPQPGFYTLRVLNENEIREIQLQVNEDDEVIELEYPNDQRLLLTDWELNCEQANFGKIWGGGWRFELQSGGEFLSAPRNGFKDCVQDEKFDSVYHLKWQKKAPSSIDTWATSGLTLANDSRGIDLSGLDSLVLWLKGKGTIKVGIVTNDMILFEDYLYPVFDEVELDSNWNRYSFSAKQIDFPLNSQASDLGFKWPNSSKNSRYLQWVINDDVELFIDSIQLVGVNIKEVLNEN